MGDKTMPAWPDPNDYCEGTDSLYEESQQCLRYERARADAAMARLRVAVEALELYAHCVANTHVTADKALQAIGPLPPAPTEGG